MTRTVYFSKESWAFIEAEVKRTGDSVSSIIGKLIAGVKKGSEL